MSSDVSSEAPKILFAASFGDLHFLIREVARGESILVADYDQRTALHLAASNGHLEVCKYVMTNAKGDKSILGAKDRFGNTPLDDAKRGGFDKCADVIAAAIK